MLEALKRETGNDLDFSTFLLKYLYAVKQVTPPCPQLDPQLLTEVKELWGLHTGKQAVEALTAAEEDMLDEVLGKPPVIRCRVCHKPSETGVHPECTRRAFSCKDFPDPPGELKPLVKPLPPNPNDPLVYQDLARARQGLYMADLHFMKPRCPQCGGDGKVVFKDCPECRPGSSKASRKRKQGT